MRYYLGDPCYIIPDEDWGEFCEATFLQSNRAKAQDYGNHCDSVFDWKGQELTIWSNGGDGTWSFDGLETTNGAKSFDVDAGIFCVIDLDKLPDTPRYEASHFGMLFDKEPNLYVEDGIVYINDIHDNSVAECWECGALNYYTNINWTCETGACDGCEICFECGCEEE